MVYVVRPATKPAELRLLMTRSAAALTVVVVRAVLFPGTGSGVDDSTAATLTIVFALFTTIRSVNSTAALPASVGITGQLTVWPSTTPPPLAERKTAPSGSVSVTRTSRAGPALRFVTRSVNSIAPPAIAVAGPVLVIARSADAGGGAIGVVTDVRLSLRSGSVVGDVTNAAFTTLVNVLGDTTTRVENVALAPFASDAIAGQVTTRPAIVPPLSALTNATLTGSVSLTTTDVAADGPLLRTVMRYVTVSPTTALAGPVFVTARLATAPTFVVSVV